MVEVVLKPPRTLSLEGPSQPVRRRGGLPGNDTPAGDASARGRGGESAVGGDELLLGEVDPTAQAAAEAESSAKTQHGQGTRHAGRQALLFDG